MSKNIIIAFLLLIIGLLVARNVFAHGKSGQYQTVDILINNRVRFRCYIETTGATVSCVKVSSNPFAQLI